MASSSAMLTPVLVVAAEPAEYGDRQQPGGPRDVGRYQPRQLQVRVIQIWKNHINISYKMRFCLRLALQHLGNIYNKIINIKSESNFMLYS